MDMNIIKQAAEQYTLSFNQNVAELQAFENILKENYNKYIDSLANYLDKCQLIKDNYNKALNSYEDKVDNMNLSFLIPDNLVIDSYMNGKKYILDNRQDLIHPSLVLVNAMSSEKLLERKIL